MSFTPDTVDYLKSELMPFLLEGDECLELTANQTTFVRNHLIPHLELGQLDVVRGCYFQYLASKKGQSGLSTAQRLAAGDLRFADLLRIQLQRQG